VQQPHRSRKYAQQYNTRRCMQREEGGNSNNAKRWMLKKDWTSVVLRLTFCLNPPDHHLVRVFSLELLWNSIFRQHTT